MGLALMLLLCRLPSKRWLCPKTCPAHDASPATLSRPCIRWQREAFAGSQEHCCWAEWLTVHQLEGVAEHAPLLQRCSANSTGRDRICHYKQLALSMIVCFQCRGQSMLLTDSRLVDMGFRSCLHADRCALHHTFSLASSHQPSSLIDVKVSMAMHALSNSEDCLVAKSSLPGHAIPGERCDVALD